jgi:hypothetical protein
MDSPPPHGHITGDEQQPLEYCEPDGGIGGGEHSRGVHVDVRWR